MSVDMRFSAHVLNPLYKLHSEENFHSLQVFSEVDNLRVAKRKSVRREETKADRDNKRSHQKRKGSFLMLYCK